VEEQPYKTFYQHFLCWIIDTCCILSKILLQTCIHTHTHTQSISSQAYG